MPSQDPTRKPNREELYQMAAQAAREGRRQPARMMLRQVLQEDPRSERAMLMMAKIAANKQERRSWLERVVNMNPDNDTAQRALDRMDYQDRADRNQLLLRLGTGIYMIVILLGAIVFVITRIAA